jgi:hypothetical protein
MVEIMLAEGEKPTPSLWPEGRPTQDDLKIGIVVAVFHDVGNASEPKDEKKIRASDVRDDPSQRKPAIEARRRHMDAGGVVIEAFLRDEGGFSDDQIAQARKLVEHHDGPTIAELFEGSDEEEAAKTSRENLFVPEAGHPLRDIYPLSAVLREADRLWMLTKPGVVEDLKRDLMGRKPWDPTRRIEGNVKRHKEERELYRQFFPKQVADWGFQNDTAFYRTTEGQKRFRTACQELPEVPGERWAEMVKEAWLR